MNQQFRYRLRLAQGFLQELQQDIGLGRWRAAMDNAQLTVENAAKSILALAGPVGRTHNPAPLLRRVLEENLLSQFHPDKIARLAELAELLGPDVHIQTDYGDEVLTPWELFDEEDARQACSFAIEAMTIVEAIAQQLDEGDEA